MGRPAPDAIVFKSKKEFDASLSGYRAFSIGLFGIINYDKPLFLWKDGTYRRIPDGWINIFWKIIMIGYSKYLNYKYPLSKKKSIAKNR